jgi:hypothetical protein
VTVREAVFGPALEAAGIKLDLADLAGASPRLAICVVMIAVMPQFQNE